MRYYPVNIDLNGSSCLVVGGGSVAIRKITTLIKCGAKITVISPKIRQEILDMHNLQSVSIKLRGYESSDVLGNFLVIGATDNEILNAKISQDAKKNGLLCNIVDKPEICNFILPAVVERGDFILTISTAGNSPAFAKKLRRELELKFGIEYGQLIELMGSIRKKLLSKDNNFEQHKFIFEKLLQNDLLMFIKENDVASIDAILSSILGSGYKYSELVS